MKHVLSLIFLLANFFLIAQSQPDFRNINWGMTIEEVKKAETANFMGEGEEQGMTFLGYSTTLLGQDCSLIYMFGGEGLFLGLYLFENNYLNAQEYFNDFESFKDILTTKYGEPITDEEIWNNDEYRHLGSSFRELALKEGHLQLITKWETKNTEIELSISAEDGNIIGPGITYNAKLDEESRDRMRQEILKDF